MSTLQNAPAYILYVCTYHESVKICVHNAHGPLVDRFIDYVVIDLYKFKSPNIRATLWTFELSGF